MKVNAELCWIRVKLTQWGRMARALGVGYPSMATMERARVGRGGLFDGPSMPDDLAEIDWQVLQAPKHHKLILVECYTKTGDFRDHAARVQLSIDAWFRRRKRAETYLNSALKIANGDVVSRAS